METVSGNSEKDSLIILLKSIDVEKSNCYHRIEEIKKQEYEINSRLGEIYRASRTDVPYEE